MEGGLIVNEELGSGSVSKVFKGTLDGQICAVKVLRALNKEHKKSLSKEFSILKDLNHENVIKVRAFIEEKDSLILDLCGISMLNNYIIDVKEWSGLCPNKSDKDDFKVCKQIVDGLEYLHGKNIIHCDLKSSNCLVTGELKNPIVKLADFGIAFFQTVTQTATQNSQARI